MRFVLSSVVVMALCATGSAQETSKVLIFHADMTGANVAPAAIETPAAARATGVLVGNRFTVHGSFTGLSSALRDIVAKPNDPGVHLHRGAPGITTPYFHGLQVKLNADERSGIFWGTATLTDEQLKSLLATEAYVDIHTAKFGPGEVRDQWRPVDGAAAAAALAALGAKPEIAAERCHTSG